MQLRLFPCLSLCAAAVACASPAEDVGSVESAEGAARPEDRTIEILPRTPHLATYPCGEQCHADRTPDPTPRTLTLFHVGRVIDHGPALHFCTSCHATENLDELVLLDGTTRVSFDASDQLCAQCHGTVHDDWGAGIHGLSTRGWRGRVERRQCAACHDPHAPDPLHFEALPVPVDARRRAPLEHPPRSAPQTEEAP